MTHVGKQVCDAFVQALGAAGTECDDRVSHRRFFPQSETVTADAIVSSPLEDINPMSQAPVLYERTITVNVTARFTGDEDGLDDRAWRFQSLAEAAIAATNDLGGLAQTVFLRSRTSAADGSGHRAVLTCALQYTVLVYTRDGEPETAL